MKEKMLLLSPDEIAIMLQALQVLVTHISITDTDTYMREFREKIESVVEKMLI